MPSQRQDTRRRPHGDSRRSISRVENIRSGLQGLFTGRSTVGRSRYDSEQIPESPKSPRPGHTQRPVLGLHNLPTTRLNIPYLARSRSDTRTHSRSESRSTHRSNTPLSPAEQQYEEPLNFRPITPNSWRQVQQGNVSTLPSHIRHNSSRRFVGVDPAEQHLATLAQDARRRRRRNKTREEGTKRRRCGMKIKNRKVRGKLLSCFISGLVRNSA